MSSRSEFPWLDVTKPRADGPANRVRVASVELANRAGLLFRLGFTQQAATARLCERVAWEHEGRRPATLDDAAVAKIVADTYARRPT